MEQFVIKVPDSKVSLVKQLLSELGVQIDANSQNKKSGNRVPNRLTAKTIEDAQKGKNLAEPIMDIDVFLDSI